MSGPALRGVESHHAIHQTAWYEAEEALEAAETLHVASDGARFARVAEVFLEVVEARILAHAAEEEAGLYREWLEADDGVRSAVNLLMLEHDTLRHLALAVEAAMVEKEHDAALSRMREFLEASAAHSRHEEAILRGRPLSSKETSL